MRIAVAHERARGCGFRKPGGLYFRCSGRGRGCGLFPIPLHICPTCGGGIKFTRGFQWVNIATLVAAGRPEGCDRGDAVFPNLQEGCGTCPLADANIQKAGLIWVGKAFYDKPEDWMKEADEMGISRRIQSVPKDFVLGETWIAAAHIEAVPGDAILGTKAEPGIFQIFRPSAIEYVVKGDETEEQLEAMVKRGITPIKVVPVGQQPELIEEENGDEEE